MASVSRMTPLLLMAIACAVPPPGGQEVALSTGELGAVEVATVILDGQRLVVAVASTPGSRTQGLRGITDLGDLDGMLFTWGGDTVTSRFTMADTPLPLDIAFFAADGDYVDGFRMTPCPAPPCPAYAASAPYAYALEFPVGSGSSAGPGSVLEFEH